MTKIKGDRGSVKRKEIKDSQTELSESTRSKRRQERQQRTKKKVMRSSCCELLLFIYIYLC